MHTNPATPQPPTAGRTGAGGHPQPAARAEPRDAFAADFPANDPIPDGDDEFYSEWVLGEMPKSRAADPGNSKSA